MAVAPYRAGQAIGFLPTTPSNANTTAINAAANWLALSFVADSARTLATIRAYLITVTGTLGASDITCDLYDSTGTGGAPGSSIETGKLPSTTITALGWYTFTGFSTVLVAGQQYWLVFKNVNGTPASNFCTFNAVSATAPFVIGSSQARQGWGFATSTNSGSTWALTTGRMSFRIGYADGSFDGLPTSSTAASAVGNGVYATRELGMKFTTPNNGVLNVRGIAMFLATITGTPTNGLRFGLWTGSTPTNQGYTLTIPQTASVGNQWIVGYFDPSVNGGIITLQPGTITRATLATSGSDASTKRYNLTEVIWDTDSNSVILLPFEGTCTKTYYNGSTWTDSALGTSMFGFALLLDTAGEFGAGVSGNSTPIFQSGIIQGLGAI